jgi:hypothetical protein
VQLRVDEIVPTPRAIDRARQSVHPARCSRGEPQVDNKLQLCLLLPHPVQPHAKIGSSKSIHRPLAHPDIPERPGEHGLTVLRWSSRQLETTGAMRIMCWCAKRVKLVMTGLLLNVSVASWAIRKRRNALGSWATSGGERNSSGCGGGGPYWCWG